MPKNLLFITWDGPQTSYMEGLFMPIFEEISKQDNRYRFHVIQFTWGDKNRTDCTQKAAQSMGVRYTAVPIYRKPIASVGSMITLARGTKKIARYIQQHQIDILMPRSTFPAMMVNRLRNKKVKILFDADGLPIEERVDFAGLKKGSWQYNWLKKAETKMLKKADVVITRSQKAIDYHLQTLGKDYKSKFFVVFNGRNTDAFTINEDIRNNLRKALNINNETLFVYAGSLGPQYCFAEMLTIFETYKQNHSAKFLILTGNQTFAESKTPKSLRCEVIIKSVPISEVPNYMNAADVAFGLRQPSQSMQGVAPIKLGEYLLCGLPVIASKGIGDTEQLLTAFNECFLYNHNIPLEEQLNNVVNWVENINLVNKQEINKQAESVFSVTAAANSYLKALVNISNEGK